jgi:hypothetical protein
MSSSLSRNEMYTLYEMYMYSTYCLFWAVAGWLAGYIW